MNTTNDENKESPIFLWFDPSIELYHDTRQIKQRLHHINDYVIFHTDLHECIASIQSLNRERIFLITSGSKASQLLPHISSLDQVDSIFIFCMQKSKYEYLLNEYSKIIGIYVNLEDLCKSIEETIHWNSEQSFVYKLINKVSQSEDIDQFDTYRIFINDLSKSLQHENEMMLLSKEEIITVYRGEKLDKLEGNQDKYISTNGYLSTSRLQSREVLFELNDCFEFEFIKPTDLCQLIKMNILIIQQTLMKD